MPGFDLTQGWSCLSWASSPLQGAQAVEALRGLILAILNGGADRDVHGGIAAPPLAPSPF